MVTRSERRRLIGWFAVAATGAELLMMRLYLALFTPAAVVLT